MTREEIRVGCYGRAITLFDRLTRPPPLTEIASQFADFVGNDGWKLQALDLALAHTHRRADLDLCLGFAAKVSDFVVPPRPVAPTTFPSRSKKATRKRYS